ncbi:MAG: class I SAM-dependent methyltransferase [Gemmatimonadaceae bacterium]
MTTRVTPATVRAHFDQEAVEGRRLLPDPATVGGLGTLRKYEHAAMLMSDAAVRDVLDVGCNRGSIESLFHDRYPERARTTRVEGVDVSTQAIAQARALGLPSCRFQSYEGATLPFPDANFDVVIMVEVIEHVMDKPAVLREIFRVLRPGGRFFLTTPNPECVALRVESSMWYVLRRLFRRRIPAKDAFIAAGPLDAMVADIGFVRADREMFAWPHAFIGMLNWGVIPPLPPSLLRRYQRFCISRLERRGLPVWLERRMHWTLATELRKP